MIHRMVAGVVVAFVLAGCQSHRDAEPTWAIAIHGGAGFAKDWSPQARQARIDGLTRALEAGQSRLAAGGSALDTVEAVVRILEDDPHFNAGRGAVRTATGDHELDAAIMDGATMRCGAVASVTTVKNPISFARQVMDQTRHVLFVGPSADALALSFGLETVPNAAFSVSDLDAPEPCVLGTVGCVAMDTHGHLAAATSTGGLEGKMPGRVGDVPVIGAGTYADGTVAVSCTGVGEQFIRHAVARTVAGLMEWEGLTVDQAGEALIFGTLQPKDGGLIAVSSTGEIALVFSTPAMPRASADSTGRFEVAIEGPSR